MYIEKAIVLNEGRRLKKFYELYQGRAKKFFLVVAILIQKISQLQF